MDFSSRCCVQDEFRIDDHSANINIKQINSKYRPHLKICQNDLFKKMFPCPEKYITQKEPTINNPQLNNRGNFYLLSRRPLQCPHNSCKKFIGVFTFESHFKYEHKEIPFMVTNLEARSCLEFRPQNVQFGTKHCITLIQLSELNNSFMPRPKNCSSSLTGPILKKSSTDQSVSSSNKCVSPIFMILVYKIADIQLSDEDERHFLIDDDLVDEETESVPLNFGDKILIWLASNITTHHSYTIAISKLTDDIRIKYYGPVRILGDDPIKICEEGEGLIMTYFHCLRMTNNGKDPLQLDVVIHED